MKWQYRDSVLLLCTVAFFITYVARVAISPVVPFITDDFTISNAQIGIALSGMWIAYGLTQYPSGVLAESIGEKRVVLLSIGGTAALSALAGAAPLFAVFVVGVVGIGAFAGLHYTVATTLLSRTYDDIGTAIGLHSLGAPAAGLLAPVASAWIGVTYGWRPAVAFVGLIAIPAFIAFAWRVRPTPPAPAGSDDREDSSVGSFGSFLRRPSIAVPAAISITAMFAINGVVSFLPTFLVEYHAYSPTLAGAVFSAYFVFRGMAQIGVGVISDRIDRDWAVAGCLSIGTVGLASFLVGPGLPWVILAVLLFGTGTSFFAALEPKVIAGLPEDERNAGFGVFRTVYVVGGSTGSIGVGVSADLVGWRSTFILLATLFATSFALVVLERFVTRGR